MLCSVAGLKACRFFEDECLEGLFGQVVELHVEFERRLGYRLAKIKRRSGIRLRVTDFISEVCGFERYLTSSVGS